jgi:3-oxoacyl-[acyl-carrier protein] reductase
LHLAEQVSLVTGSGRGIGLTIALALAEHGANVVINDVVEENARAAAAQVQKLGREAMVALADVTSKTEVQEMVESVMARFGRIDILVNNAGITRDSLLIRMSEEQWDAVLSVNLKGAFLCTKAVSRPMLKARSGRIINIASVVGLTGNAGQANYSASKGGLIALTKTTAQELASRGITANAIAPGFIETEMTDRLPAEAREQMLARVPLGRAGQAEDVANAVVFLAGPDAAYITGQVLTVDGGMVM